MAPYLFWELFAMALAFWVVAVGFVVFSMTMATRQKQFIQIVLKRLDQVLIQHGAPSGPTSPQSESVSPLGAVYMAPKASEVSDAPEDTDVEDADDVPRDIPFVPAFDESFRIPKDEPIAKYKNVTFPEAADVSFVDDNQ